MSTNSWFLEVARLNKNVFYIILLSWSYAYLLSPWIVLSDLQGAKEERTEEQQFFILLDCVDISNTHKCGKDCSDPIGWKGL